MDMSFLIGCFRKKNAQMNVFYSSAEELDMDFGFGGSEAVAEGFLSLLSFISLKEFVLLEL